MNRVLQVPPLTPRGPRLADARRLVKLIARWRPLRVSSDDAIGRSHAWQIAGVWDRTQKRWEVQVDPISYVNGREVLCPAMPLDELPQATLDRLKAAGGALPARARALLSDGPSLPVRNWRAVGTDALAIDGKSEAIPEYFLERGVVPPDNLSTNGGDSITIEQTSSTEEQRKTQRLLRGVDIILNQPRPSTRLEVGENNRPEARLVLPGDDSPYITIQPDRYEPAAEGGSIQELFAGALGDDGVDRLNLGTLWLLSPAGIAPGRDPDETWTAYGQNEVFYSVDHDVNIEINIIEPIALGFDIPLAGGVAALTISSLQSEIEANDAYASAFLSTARVTGSFRTI